MSHVRAVVPDGAVCVYRVQQLDPLLLVPFQVAQQRRDVLLLNIE